MKKQLRSILLFTAITFTILIGCSKSDSMAPPSENNSPRQNTDLTTTNSAQNSSGKTAVTITGVYDFSTLPNTIGTFTTTGALTISGYSTMFVDIVNHPGSQFHCVVTLYAPDGIITINQECTFDTPTPKGQWNIVSGTGPYVNLKGNGSLTMPPNTEAMTGVIFNNNN